MVASSSSQKMDPATITPDEGTLPPYTRNKIRTLFQLIQSIRNWPDAVELRLWRKRPRLRLLEFRNGINVIVRGGTNEWSVLHELFFAHGYQKAFQWLAARREAAPYVLDLGGNIGLFALLAANDCPRAKITSFEPGPPNIRLYQMNMLANPELARNIELRQMAVAGTSGEAVWNFDADNPGGSSIQTGDSPVTTHKHVVKLASFAEIVAEAPGDIALVKMDIECAEWDVLAKTPAETWSRVQAVALELHTDPSGRRPESEFIGEMKALGFKVEVEAVCTYFLHR